ncbi:alpha/beta fold hydrolase [Rhodococcus sp. X156]|uniref:alpha/beta fold hydrolase n=1 Tax=Rhodococcus sp. X156 TaxID=2499145 RepID=UPI000FDB8A8F|nr:alpha/beta fold hydrolase [Rhodococcus sp. X156]
MSSPLHLHHHGSPSGPTVLALHGVTGHGGRWWGVAEHLPEVNLVAPDLRGHGRSPARPPWTMDQHVADLCAVLAELDPDPVVLVGHSYGGAIAVHLARAVPHRIRALLLLDPAMAVPAGVALECAQAACAPPVFADAEQARAQQRKDWAAAPQAAVDAEVDQHLVERAEGGLTWRLSTPAMVASWSELARPSVAPPAGLPTVVLRAGQVHPPYLTDATLEGWREVLGDALRLQVLDAGHMVEQEQPAVVAELVRAALVEQ